MPFLHIHISSRTSNSLAFESNSKFGSFANFAAFAARRRSLPHYSGLNSILPGLQTIPVAWWEPLPHSRPPSSIFSLFLVRVFHCAQRTSTHVVRILKTFSARFAPTRFCLTGAAPLCVSWDRHPSARPTAPRPLQNTYIFPSKSKISLTFPSPFILGLRRVPNNYPCSPRAVDRFFQITSKASSRLNNSPGQTFRHYIRRIILGRDIV